MIVGGLSGGGVGSEEKLEEYAGMDALASGGLNKKTPGSAPNIQQKCQMSLKRG
jgi:hypothetical protein